MMSARFLGRQYNTAAQTNSVFLKGWIPVGDYSAARALSYYYFENMLMLIVILWLIKWLFAC